MSNPSPVFATLDPTRPLGAESLRTGPQRIKQTPTGVLDLIGLPDNAPATFYSPIKDILNPNTALNPSGTQLAVWNDPQDPFAVVTKRYADRRTLFILLDGGGGPNFYTATVDAALNFSLDQNAIYLIRNGGATNAAGGVSIQINGGPVTPVARMDGTNPLAAGEFLSGATYAMSFDVATSRFRIIGFIGGTLTQPLILAADPTVALEAATKQYVDAQQAIYGLTRVQLGGDLPPAVGDQVVLSQTLTTPNDGRTYRVYTSYNMLITFAGNNLLQTYCVDDPQTGIWAQSNGIAAPISGAAGGGYSGVTFPSNTAVTVKLHGTIPALIWTAKANFFAIGEGTYLDMGFVLA